MALKTYFVPFLETEGGSRTVYSNKKMILLQWYMTIKIEALLTLRTSVQGNN